jgi:dynactin 1
MSPTPTLLPYALVLTIFRNSHREIGTLRQTTATAESAQQSAAAQAAAVLSMNLKLQSSAAKQRAKEIDYELSRGQEKESREKLGILTPYLPDAYRNGGDLEALNAFFCFGRLAWKSDTINKVVADIHGLPKVLEGKSEGKDGKKDGGVNEVLVGICEVGMTLYFIVYFR